jgi:nitrogen fixation/metabolism regulation signal transduction histidine kinase
VPNAEIRLEIEDVLDEAGQRFTRLSVLDNGPGLIAEIKSRLFEPYFTSKPKGSGLGLAIVKKIVEENRTPDKIMLTKYSDSAGYFLTDLLNPNNSSVVNS